MAGEAADTDQVRQEVALSCRVLAAAGMSDMVWGHVSARDPRGRGIWMKAHLLGFEEVTEDDVLLVSFDGEVLEGRGRRHGEYPIHTELMRARDDVNSVIHTHAVPCVAFAATGQVMRPISHEGARFSPPDIPRFTRTGDLVLTRELGESLAETVGRGRAALMPNHGMVAAAASIAETTMAAIWLSLACATQLLAGEVKNWSSDEEAIAKQGHSWSPDIVTMGWDYWVRRVERGA